MYIYIYFLFIYAFRSPDFLMLFCLRITEVAGLFQVFAKSPYNFNLMYYVSLPGCITDLMLLLNIFPVIFRGNILCKVHLGILRILRIQICFSILQPLHTHLLSLFYRLDIKKYLTVSTLFPLEHIGLVVRMSILDTEVDGTNPSISMLFP